LEMFDLIWLMK